MEVTRRSDDGLSEQFWRFAMWADHGGKKVVLSLADYQVRSRPSTRHKMKVDHKWSRMDQRSYHSDIKAADVPLPDDVVAEARAAVEFVVEGPIA
jgi:hypothetical protein